MDIPTSPAEAMEMMTRIKYAVPMTKWTVYWAGADVVHFSALCGMLLSSLRYDASCA